MLGMQITDVNRGYRDNDPVLFNYSFDPSQFSFGQGLMNSAGLGGLVNGAFWDVNRLNSQNMNQYREALAGPAYAYQTAVDTQKLKNQALQDMLKAFSGMADGMGLGGLGGVKSNFGQGVTVGSGAKPTNTARFAGQAAGFQQPRGGLADILNQFNR